MLWRNRVFLNGIGGSRKAEKMCKDDPRSGQPKTQRTVANVDTVRILVRSDRRLGVKEIAEELNMNRGTVRQIVKEDLGIRKNSTKMVSRILTHDEIRRLHISSDLLRNAEMFDRVTTGDETCLQYGPETKRQSMQWKNTEFISAEKSTHVSVAGQDHACVFLRSKEDSSLWIHCTRTNGKPSVILKCWKGYWNLFGGKDPDSGLISGFSTMTMPQRMVR